MKLVFGLLSLVIVLAVLSFVAKKQLRAVDGGVVTRMNSAASQAQAEAAPPGDRDGATLAVPGGVAGATAADPNATTVLQQSRAMQDKVRDDTARALQQGVDRNNRADR